MKLALVIFEDVDKIDIKEVKILDFKDSKKLNLSEDINDYAEWWLCHTYGLLHNKFYEVFYIEDYIKTDFKFFNRDDMY